jgi:hypothetical protein
MAPWARALPRVEDLLTLSCAAATSPLTGTLAFIATDPAESSTLTFELDTNVSSCCVMSLAMAVAKADLKLEASVSFAMSAS